MYIVVRTNFSPKKGMPNFVVTMTLTTNKKFDEIVEQELSQIISMLTVLLCSDCDICEYTSLKSLVNMTPTVESQYAVFRNPSWDISNTSIVK